MNFFIIFKTQENWVPKLNLIRARNVTSTLGVNFATSSSFARTLMSPRISDFGCSLPTHQRRKFHSSMGVHMII